MVKAKAKAKAKAKLKSDFRGSENFASSFSRQQSQSESWNLYTHPMLGRTIHWYQSFGLCSAPLDRKSRKMPEG